MNEPVRIIRIITRMNVGGPAVHAALLSNDLNPQKFSTCLLAGEPDPAEGDLGELVDGHRVRCVRLKRLRRAIRPWADLVCLCQLLRIVWREHPRIIHTHMAKAGALGRLAGVIYNRIGPGRRPGARAILIHTFHGHTLEGYFSPHISRLFITIERWLASRSDGLVAVSRSIRDDLLARGIGRREQWRVIPLGLNLSALAQLALPDASPAIRIGMVGRLVPIKNPALFLEALHRISREGLHPPVLGVVVGDGPLRNALEDQARALGLERIVRFTGWRRDLSSVYEGLEIACLTSWNEGTPVALIEAMAAGRPVVATDVGGVRDLLEEEGGARVPIAPGGFRLTERGILVRPGDVDGLAAALRSVVANDGLRNELARNARASVVQRYSRERLLQDIAALYDTLQGGAK